MNLILRRSSMRGFLFFQYLPRVMAAIRDLASWKAAGMIQNPIDVIEGIENAPAALQRLFTGANLGKKLVKL